MRNENRVPVLRDDSYQAMQAWFADLLARDMFYHPDERAADIVRVSDGSPSFSTRECGELDTIMAQLFRVHGDAVYEAAEAQMHAAIRAA